MKCPNCQSADLIDVQSQKFCLNCGLLIPQSRVNTATTQVAVTAKAKRPVGRPKSPKLDTPVLVEQKASEMVVASPKESAVTRPDELGPGRQIKRLPIAVRGMDDVRPSKLPAIKKPADDVNVGSTGHATHLKYPSSAWFRRLGSLPALLYAAPVALWFGAVVGVALYSYSRFPWRGASLSVMQVDSLIALVLMIWGAAILASWGQAAIEYGSIRSLDHRALPTKRWGSVALAAAGAESIVNAITVAVLVVLLSGGIALTNVVKLSASAPMWLISGVVFVGYMLIVYLIIAVLLMRRLTVLVVVLSGATIRQSMYQASSWIGHQPELLTIEIYEAVLWLVGWAAPLAAAAYLLTRLNTMDWLVATAAMIAVIAFIQQLRAAGWQQQLYYQLAQHSDAALRGHLLGGRQTESVGFTRAAGFCVTLIAMAATAGWLLVATPVIKIPGLFG